MQSITRDQLRAAVAAGLQNSPNLPSDKRYALTEFAANARHVAVGVFETVDGRCRCPVEAVHPGEAVTDDEWEFIDAFDQYMLRLGVSESSVAVV